MKSKKKLWLIVIIAICLVLPFVIFVAQAILFSGVNQKTPEFSKLRLNRIERHTGCYAIITDDSCWTKFYYDASGSEKELAESVVNDLAKDGYQLYPNTNDRSGVVCHAVSSVGSSTSHTETFEDIYNFYKNIPGHKNPNEMTVSFITDITDQGIDQVFGCSNQTRQYKIEVSKLISTS